MSQDILEIYTWTWYLREALEVGPSCERLFDADVVIDVLKSLKRINKSYYSCEDDPGSGP